MSTPTRMTQDIGGKRSRKPRNNNGNPTTSPQTPPAKRESLDQAADMSVLVSRLDLYDSGKTDDHPCGPPQYHLDYPRPPVAPFLYDPDSRHNAEGATLAICRCPTPSVTPVDPLWMQIPVVDTTTPCPHTNHSLTKYWNQRRRLFSRFDHGIQLDDEGWFSVTPEQIANHVAYRLRHLFPPPHDDNSTNHNNTFPEIVVLDAFCGCGGNAIAFARQPNVTVIGVDIDRTKLRRAAHNASLYGIPPDRLILVECNVLFLIEYCYKDRHFVLDQPLDTPEAANALMQAMPPPVETEKTPAGYQIGGIDLLPRTIDAIFMDPPWGGVDYEVLGKHGYDLERNMKIARPVPPKPVANATTGGDSVVGDDFFDCFLASPRNNQERKAQFNCIAGEMNCVNGVELLQMAAAATRCVLYDVPRNTNRQCVAKAALAAGYRGNCRWEEHYLNGRLKTVTVYFGHDWRHLLAQEPSQQEQDDSQALSRSPKEQYWFKS